MELDKNSVAKGSGVDMVVATWRRRKHIISRTILIHPTTMIDRASAPRVEVDGDLQSLELHKIGSTGLFTAADDGQIIWDVLILNAWYNSRPSDNGKVVLNIASKPENVRVDFYAAVYEESYGPLKRKPPCESYCAIMNKDTKVLHVKSYDWRYNTDYPTLRLRIDLTYTKTGDQSRTPAEYPLAIPVTHRQYELHSDRSLFSIAALLENPISSDVTLKADGQEWRVHKDILSLRSSVFAAMFSADMIEKTADSVEIKDVDRTSFDLMIKYIYGCGLARMEEDVAVSVMFLAERFDLMELKFQCEAQLVLFNLKTENCLMLFLAAKKCDAKLLKGMAENKLATDFYAVSKSDEWKDFVKEDFERSLAIMQSAFLFRSEELDERV